MSELIYEWQRRWFKRRWWMARVCYSVERDEILWVAFPLQPLCIAVWWIQDRWARKANARSWIDNEAERRKAAGNRGR